MDGTGPITGRSISISVVVCAYNEADYLGACLHSLLAQIRLPDEIVVVDNASTDRTAAVAATVPGVTVVVEPNKGLVRARDRGVRKSIGDVIAFLDADCRAPIEWLARLERRFVRRGPDLVAVTGPYRYYDWDVSGPLVIRAYDLLVAPPAQFLIHDMFAVGSILYGGNFALRRQALHRIGGFDTAIEFHGEDTNLGRRLSAVGTIELRRDCWLHTSARRFRAMGKRRVLALYLRNFLSEILLHRPVDKTHVDIRS